MSAPPLLAPDRERLKSRADYFFSSRARSRGEISGFVRALAKLGRVAVIGGLLRDLYLSGNRRFASDVDFVVHPDSLKSFDAMIQQMNAKQNRFGGCRLRLGHWAVDVWPLQRTWAHVAGHVDVQTLEDLRKVTFFDWDAIVYVIPERKLLACPSYFARLNSRILDVNLEPNPNPLGNAVRALRYAWRWDAKLGPHLGHHVLSQIYDQGWDNLVAAERASFSTHLLSSLDLDKLLKSLAKQERSGWSSPVQLPLEPAQQEFPFA